ncbi:LysM peptidoglycan-binding domain-containing protein [Alysiella filiformis]|uniref:LysM peptidoglycan-binding domain-containing protein n=1 Tax=Alysiella filiformis TaxID=194196 RepID=UPI0027BA92AF|nr:LysM peptidoglycan-binding domain-containing protein [Alysiella filiformis]
MLPAVAHGKESNTAGQVGMAMMRLNAAPLSEGSQGHFAEAQKSSHTSSFAHSSGSIWKSLKNGFRMAEVNSSLVRSHESKFVANSAYFNRTIARSQPYMYHIANEVRKRGMPAEIALLPFIESAYVTKARSQVGASGLWQFMPATGRHYGLEQTPLYDGRHDVYASTDAALNYLQYLHGLFGDWSLALAAYNWGEGNVSRAVRRAQAAGLAPTYENLRMPAETRNYVPKLLAVRNLVNNPQAYGLALPDIQDKPYFQAVHVDTPLDIMAAAHLANISETEFLALNPAFKTPVFIPKGGRKMLLPVNAAKNFETNLRNTDSKALLSWDVFTPNYAMSLNDIAAQTGTNLSELRRMNGINGSVVSAGRSILVAKNGSSNAQGIKFNFAKVDNDTTPDTFVEQKPVLTNFVVSAAPVVQNNFAVATAAAPVLAPKIDFVAQNKATQPVVNAAAASVVAAPVHQVSDVAENAGLNTAADPLFELVNQRERERLALQQTRQAVEESNAALRLAEAKEQKRRQKQQELREKEKARLAAIAAQQQQAKATQATQTAQVPPVSVQMVKGSNAYQNVAYRAPAQNKANQEITTHRVVQGDTLFNIAQRYNVNVSDLIAANNLRGNHIRIGQVLKVSGLGNANNQRTPLLKVSNEAEQPTVHLVKKGDTLTNIAARYNLKMSDIKRLNNNREDVKIGETLQLTES